jgi:predicted dehydrogenase
VWGFQGSEDNGYVLMRTAAGQLGSLHASWTEWRGYRFYLDICGTRGAIRVWYPPMLTVLYDRPAGSARRARRQIFFFPMMQVQERLRSYLWTVEQSFVAEHLDFMQRVASGSGVGASGVDGLRAVELVSSAYKRSANLAERSQAQFSR